MDQPGYFNENDNSKGGDMETSLKNVAIVQASSYDGLDQSLTAEWPQMLEL